jgi:hypothetical protein
MLEALERFPIKWNHLIDKEKLKFKELGHVLIEKAVAFLRTCSKPAAFSLILRERPRKSGAFFAPANYSRSVLNENISLLLFFQSPAAPFPLARKMF